MTKDKNFTILISEGDVMKTTIIYIHDIGSSGENALVKSLRYNLPELDIISPTFDFAPASTLSKLKQLLIDNQDSQIVVIGQFLGGLYAWYCHCVFGCKAILIDPVINPTKKLIAFVGTNLYSEPDNHSQSYYSLYDSDLKDLQIISNNCKFAESDNKKDCLVLSDINTDIGYDMKYYNTVKIKAQCMFSEVINGVQEMVN